MAHVLAKDLRDAVLQAAIQGKLTKQLKDDTPVEEILKSIEEQKRTLIKKNKLKKKKPFHLISNDEIPFDIPDNWVFAKLGYISTYDEAKQKINARDANDNLWMLDLEDIAKGGTLLCKKRVFERKAIGDKTVFEKGSILYSKLRPYLLKILIADEDGICTPELVPFKMYGGINTSYIALFLKSPYVDSEINKVTYGVKMPRVGTKTMVNFYVPLPPIEEQQRIVDRVDELMSKVDEYEKLENQLVQLKEQFPKDMRDSLLQAGMMGKLTKQLESDTSAKETYILLKEEKDEEKRKKSRQGKLLPVDLNSTPFEIPNEWLWLRNSEVTRFINGRAYKKEELLPNGKYPILRVGNLFSNDQWYYSDLELDEDKYCDSGDLIYAWSASFGPTIWNGAHSIFHYHIWKLDCAKNINKKFLYYSLLEDTSNIKANSHGLGFVFVTKKYIENRLIPFPPIEEQQRIVDKLDEMLPLVDALAQMD